MPQAIAFDCYRTLFDNSHDDWKKTFDEIIKAQNLPLNAEDFWTRWRKYEVNFRSIRTDLGRPFDSPPFKSYREAWTECFEQVFKDIGVNADANAAGDRASLHMTDRPIYPETLEALDLLTGRVKLGVFSNADDEGLLPLLTSARLKFDFVASSQSGATTVWINRDDAKLDREPVPDIEITDLRELSEILEHIGG